MLTILLGLVGKRYRVGGNIAVRKLDEYSAIGMIQ
jgi:hypothetical protein